MTYIASLNTRPVIPYNPPARTKKDVQQDKQIVQLKKQVRNLSKTDNKYNHTTVAETTLVNSTPKSHLLNGISQGTSSTARIGNSLKWLTLEARLYFIAQAALPVDTPIRIMVVRTKQNKGDAFTWADLFSTTTPAERALFNYEAKNISKLFDIVYDKSIMLGKYEVNGTSPNMHTFGTNSPSQIMNFNRKLNFTTTYNSSGNTVSDIETNSLHLLVFTDTATASAIHYNINVSLKGEDI